jgi:putative transposase
MPHRPRAGHERAHPAHLTLRARAGIPWLRQPRVFHAIQDAIARASRDDFRVLHFSVQGDHMHLIVEADDAAALRAGASGLAIRTARAINKALGRSGSVWADRYHRRDLATPREVRNAIVYVLMNFRKHHRGPPEHLHDALDACSSARWFDGFLTRAPTTSVAPPTRPPATWLAATGWRKHGLVALSESPVSPH